MMLEGFQGGPHDAEKLSNFGKRKKGHQKKKKGGTKLSMRWPLRQT